MSHGNEASAIKILVLASKYAGDYPLLNHMTLGISPAYDAKVCYLSGRPDGKNTLDGLGRAIYLDCDGTLGGSKIKTLFALVKLLKKERPEILHCHRHKPTVYGAVAARLAGVPHVVSHVHGLNRTRSLVRKITNRFVFSAVDRIITVSDVVNKDVLRTNTAISPEKVVTVHNGIDAGMIDAVSAGRDEARARLGIKKDAIVFGTVGRLAPTKGQVYLLEAFSMTLKNLPGSALLITGDGQLRAELVKKTEDLGIAGSVRFLGHRSDVLEIMRSFDVFVFPSLAEGLPLALLEAMASGVIVVASNVGGIPDVLGNGLYGRLVPPCDAVTLATAMKDAALLSAEEKKKTADAGRKRVLEEFTEKVMCKALMDVYKGATCVSRGYHGVGV